MSNEEERKQKIEAGQCPEPDCQGALHNIGLTLGATKLLGCSECFKVFWKKPAK